MKYKLSIIPLIILITGCTEMNGNYDCPLKSMSSCTSLQDMDRSISASSTELETSSQSSVVSQTSIVHRDQLPKSYPKRTTDLVAKIWVAPYEDDDGNYHDSSYMYSVIESSTWQGKPTKI